MSIKSAIFSSFEDGKILVFPKEITARSYIKAYAKQNPDKAVFSDSAMSWDRFKDSLRHEPENLKSVQKIHRYLFAYSFLKSDEAKNLKYFSNSSFPESVSGFVQNLVNNLVYFGKASTMELSAGMNEDIKIILEAYAEFLKQNNLYEKEFIQPDFSEIQKGKYVLVFPSTIDDYDINRIPKDKFDFIDTDDRTELNTIGVYQNALCEIREAVRNIFGILKDRKENGAEIAITLNQFDSYLPYLVSECNKRNIRLSIQQGKKLSDFSSVKFFSAIKALNDSDFDFDNLKKFLLNPVFPFKDFELVSNTIRIGIKYRIAKGFSQWEYKLGKITDSKDAEEAKDVGEFIKALSASARKFCRSRNADDLRSAYHEFQDNFFSTEAWHNLENDTERSAFERALVLIDDTETQLEDCGITDMTDFFGFYNMLLSYVTYTSNSGTEGIKVYAYPQSRGIYAKYHFVLGLSDSDVQQKRKALPFISDIDDTDSQSITDEILKSYALKDENFVSLSCAEDSFSSTGSEPSLFVEKNLSVRCESHADDSFEKEEQMWYGISEETVFLDTQKRWFENSEKAISSGLRAEEFAEVSLPVNLSATQMSDFEKCPYKWLCSSFYKLGEEDFEIDMQDNKGIGNILHETYREFFETVGKFGQFATEQNQKLMREIFSKKIQNSSNRADSPDALHLLETELKFKDIITSVATAQFSEKLESASVDSMEKEPEEIISEEYRINGRVDCILKFPDGEFAVIDFKKSKVNTKGRGDAKRNESFQLLVYASLLENSNSYKRTPVLAAFYSVKEQKFYSDWESKDKYDIRRAEFENLKNSIISHIKNRDFKPTPSNDNCEYCTYRRLCRKRFVVK